MVELAERLSKILEEEGLAAVVPEEAQKVAEQTIETVALPKKKRDKLLSSGPLGKYLPFNKQKRKRYSDRRLKKKLKDKLYGLVDLYFSLEKGEITEQTLERFGNIMGEMSRGVYVYQIDSAMKEKDPAARSEHLGEVWSAMRRDVVYHIGKRQLKAAGDRNLRIDACINEGMQYLESQK